MSQTSIGKAALVLTTDGTDAKAGLAKFGSDANKWADKTTNDLKSRFSGLGKAGLFGFAAGGAAAAGSALLSLPGQVIGKYRELKDEIDNASKAARRFGTDMGTWQGLAHAASMSGVPIEQLTVGLTKFQQKIDGPIDKALLNFARSIEGVEDPAERARILFDAFGKAGPAMAGLFENGGDGLQKMIAESKELGFALSDLDGQKVEEANDSIERAERAVKGLWQRIVVALAPAFEGWGRIIQQVAVKLGPVFDWIGRAIEAYWDIASAVFEELVGAIEYVVDEIGSWIEEMFGAGAMTLTIKDVIVGVFRVIGTAIALTWDTLKFGAGIAAIAFGAIIEYGGTTLSMFRSIVDLGRRLPESLRPAGFNEFADQVAAADDKVRGWGRGLKEWGVDAVTTWGSSAVQFNKWLDKVANRQKEAAQDAKNDVAELAQTVEALKAAGNAPLLKGTSAEVSARFKHDFGGKLQEQLAEQKKASGLLREIRDQGKDREPSVVVELGSI